MKNPHLAPNRTPILVIGAGMAGIAAARKLRALGFVNVTIWEARNRIGGRIWTDRSQNTPLDMGAAWIHGPSKNNPIKQLADEANARTFVTDDDSLEIYRHNGRALSDEAIERYEARYESLLEQVSEEAERGESLRDALERLQPNVFDDLVMQYQFSAYAEFDGGASVEEMAAEYWDDDENFAGRDVVLPDGYDALVQYAAKGLDIRLGKSVKRIDYSGDMVVAQTLDGERFNAKHVIVTVPLGVLRENAIQFTPALPSKKLGAISRLRMGLVNKVVLFFPYAFWEVKTQYFGYASPLKGKYPYFVNARTFSGENILITFGLGNYAYQVEKFTKSELQQDVMEVLRTMFGDDIPTPTQILATRWANDPLTFGSYSYCHHEATPADFDQLARSVDDKLFFAGEHTHRVYRATVHGAFLSGEREAEKIAALYA